MSRRWMAAACGTVGWTVLLGPASRTHGQPTAPPLPSPSPSPSPGTLVLAGQTDLARLVDLCAQRLKVTIEYDPQVVKGMVTLRLGGDGEPNASGQGGLSDAELWELTNDLLAARGFTTVRTPGDAALHVVKLADAAGLAGLDRQANEPIAAGFTSAVVRLEHKPAKDIVESLKAVLSKPAGGGGAATALGDSGLILISDLAPRVRDALELLQRLDVPGPAVVTQQVRLQHVAAAPLVTLLNQVSLKREAMAGKMPGDVLALPDGSSVLLVSPQASVEFWHDLIGQLDQREPVETRTYAPRTFGVKEVGALIEQAVRGAAAAGPPAAGTTGSGGDERWRVVVDTLTGTLIVTATPVQHEQIRGLMDRLDQAPASARRPTRTFVIRNRSVKEIVAVLEKLVQGGVLTAGAFEAGLNPPSSTTVVSPAVTTPLLPPSAQTATATTPSGAGITSSQPSSAARSPAIPASGGAAITRLAEPPLVLTADEGTNTLIATGEPAVLNQLEALLKTLDVRQAQVMLEVMLVSLSDAESLSLGVELEKLTTLAGTAIRLSSLFGLSAGLPTARTVADASGFTGVVLNPGDFDAIVRALQSINKGRSESTPRVLVNNNQQAVLNSTLSQPFASLNASTTVATTSFGGQSDAGTAITVKPQIAEGDHLILEYQVELSSFAGPAASPNLPPPKQQNKVQSVATIPDGYTVVVGGIDVGSETKSTTQIPLLGDIPGIGELFKSRANATSHTRFFVFIHASVMRDKNFEDLKYLSKVNTDQARVDDGFPEVEPRLIR